MKSERGQTQESQLLADKLDEQLGVLRKYIPGIAAVAAVVVVVLLGYGIYTTQTQGQAARAWTDWYFSDTQVPNMESISKDFPSTSAAAWARITAGDANMSKALDNWFLNSAVAEQMFKQAADEYRAATHVAADSFTKSRAHFGLAQALEGLGTVSEAIAEYRKVGMLTGIAPEFAAEAKKRVAWLESKDGEAFLDWYKTNRVTNPVELNSKPELPSIPGLPDIKFEPTENSGTSKPEVPGSEAAPTQQEAAPPSEQAKP